MNFNIDIAYIIKLPFLFLTFSHVYASKAIQKWNCFYFDTVTVWVTSIPKGGNVCLFYFHYGH